MHKHPFHLVSPSPYPILASLSSFFFFGGLVIRWSSYGASILVFGLFSLAGVCFLWWDNVVAEATFLGFHTQRVQSGLRFGFLLFIISECFFFLSFFWAYLHSSLSPAVELGSTWPPLGILPVQPFTLPFLNTCLLLSSGATITWAHSCLISGSYSTFIFTLSFTILLGITFTVVQLWEYFSCSFSIADSVFGSCFFLATGFHGLHVLVGTLFLLTCLFRGFRFHFSPTRHLGFLFATWYWHFVDVIWLLLWLIVYIW